MTTYAIDINVGYNCNFRCKYCFEKLGDKNYNNTQMSQEVIEKTCEYIEHLLNTRFKNDKIRLYFYGGEPLLHIDVIESFITRFCNNEKVSFDITTNGTLIDKYIDRLVLFKQKTNNRLGIAVSYDYSLQDVNRQEGTYKLIRDNILLIHKNNIKVSTITVFTKESLQYFDKVVLDFLKLRRQIPYLKLVFNIDRVNASNTIFDKDKSKEALSKTKNMFSNSSINVLSDYIKYNDSCRFRNDREPLCIIGAMYTGFTVDGSMYPMYNILHAPEYARKLLYLGNVTTDNFEQLDKNHEILYKTLNFDAPEQCRSCNIPCRVLPWRTMKSDNIDEFNKMPEEEHCEIHHLLADFLR